MQDAAEKRGKSRGKDREEKWINLKEPGKVATCLHFWRHEGGKFIALSFLKATAQDLIVREGKIERASSNASFFRFFKIYF